MSVTRTVKLPNLVSTEDVWKASYCLYLGYPTMKCTDSGLGVTKWFFQIPEFDFQACLGEFESDHGVQVKSYTAAVKSAWQYQKLARQNGGEYISPAWRARIQGN